LLASPFILSANEFLIYGTMKNQAKSVTADNLTAFFGAVWRTFGFKALVDDQSVMG